MTVDTHWRPMQVAGIALTLGLAACGAGTPGSSDGDGGSALIFVSGSSTVEPISLANADKFTETEQDVGITVEGPGTSDGFALFCAGESDVSDASRPIREAEVEECAANGVEFIELYVAIDGLSVITSAENAEVDCLSFTDLWALLGPDAPGNGSNWREAEPIAEETAEATDEEFGAIHTPYPDATVSITAPGEESGTFDSFVEIVLEPVGDALEMEDVTTTPNYQASPDDNVIIQATAGSPSSLAWVGYYYYQQNAEVVRALAIDDGSGCVEPTVDTIASGEYPIARPLFIYVNLGAAEQNPALVDFIDFYLSDEGRASVTEVGYVDIPDEDWQATVETWNGRVTGTHVGD